MTTTNTISLDDIRAHVEVLASYRACMGALVGALNAGIEELKADALPELRKSITAASAAWAEVVALIEAHPQYFERPRTVTAHGIRFGLQKSIGWLEIADPDKTVRLIEKLMPEQAEQLIDVKKRPSKEGLERLSAVDLKRLGVEVKGAGDQVVIKPADGEVDKLLKALLKSSIDDEKAERKASS